jgi:hypothetical protein
MLNFNIAGRLIGVCGKCATTPQEQTLLSRIDRLLDMCTLNATNETLSKLRRCLIEYTNNPDIDTIFCTNLYLREKDRIKSTKYVLDGKVVNELPDNVFFCNYCNEYHSLKHTTKNVLDDDNVVCDMAMSRAVTECRVCHKKFLRIFDPYRHLCRDCHNELEKYSIKRYHDTPMLKFYDENGETNSCYGEYYGVELEVDKGGESNDVSKDVIKLLQERVYTMHDGSLRNGFEIITHPHTENALLNLNWQETFKWLVHKGYRSHDVNTCGLHLHINRRIFNSHESVAKMIYFYENNFDEILKVSRRNRDQACRWAGRYGRGYVSYDEALDIIDDYDRNNCHDDRYKCVNLQKNNTVEIRIMKGTLNYNSFMACLDFMITVAKNSNKVRDLNSWDEWLDGISDNTKEYLSTRKAFGYPPQEQVIEDDCYDMSNEEIINMENRVCVL